MAGRRPRPIELGIGPGRSVQEQIVQEPPLGRQQRGVHGPFGHAGQIGGGQSGGLLIHGFSELPYIVGQQTLKEFDRVRTPEPNHRPRLEDGGQRPSAVQLGFVVEGSVTAGNGFGELQGEFETEHSWLL